jgi:hypothetical protein
MTHGSAERRRLTGLADLAALIDDLKPIQAIGLGALRADLAEKVEISTKDRIASNPDTDAIARTKSNVAYVPGRPALALLDHDSKGMPPSVAAKIDALGGFWNAIASVIPKIADAGRVERMSTSAGISRSDTGEAFPGSAGRHVYLIARDGGDIDRFLTTLNDRAWLSGLGWLNTSVDGKLLERSIIDETVRAAERLVFEGGPIVEPPLVQDREARRAKVFGGGGVDTVAACPDLSPDEKRKKAALRAAEEARLAPEAATKRAEYIDREAAKLRDQRPDISDAEAEAVVRKRVDSSILYPDSVLEFDDVEMFEGAVVTAGDVLDDPSKYANLTLADPIDGIAGGRGKAKLFIGEDDGRPIIHSFAHGGRVFRLRYDLRAVRERIEAAEDKIEALARLLPLADVDAVEEDRLVRELAKAEKVGVRAIRKKIAEVKAERADRGKDKAEEVVERLNSEFAVVIAGNKTAVMMFEGDDFRPLQVDSFRQWYSNNTITVGEKLLSIADLWLDHPKRRQYSGIEFAPGGGREGYYNLWQGFAVEPRPGDCSKFLAHIRDNVARGDERLFEWVVGWFAQIVQQPDVKLGTSLVLIGEMGVGKTKVGEIVGSIIGKRHYTLVDDARYVTGQFNRHQASLLLLQADEAFFAGDKRAEGKLKGLVTGSSHFIEFKGIDPVSVDNFLRLLITGNEGWVVPASFDERRFAVLEVGTDRKQDIEYFAAIDREMNNGGREALLHHLLNFDLSKVDLRVVPRTAALLVQQIHSADARQQWWFELLQRGQLPHDPRNETANECVKDTLFADYIRHANRQGARYKSIETQVGMFLSKHVGPALKQERREYNVIRNGKKDVDRERFFVFPSLKECRSKFAAKLRQEIRWDEPEAEWERGKAGLFNALY